jgi:hypothetical protein
MKIPQLSVFIENKVGRLAEIANTLGEIGTSIRAMSLADTSEFGILRLIVDDPENARNVLREYGYAVRLAEVIAVEIPDTPGQLGRLLDILKNDGLNVEYMYAFVQKHADSAVMILRVEDLDRGVETLVGEGYSLLSAEAVYDL